MLKRLFTRPRPSLHADVEAEALSICRAGQIERLTLSAHLQRDIGLDCGCVPTTRHR